MVAASGSHIGVGAEEVVAAATTSILRQLRLGVVFWGREGGIMARKDEV